MSVAEKNRVNKIILYVWEYPFCSFSEILNDGKITKNREDLKHDVEFLTHLGCIQQISFIQRYYAFPVTKDLEYLTNFLKNMDELVSIIRKNSIIKNTLFYNQIKKNKSPHEKISPARILRICNEFDYPADKTTKIFSLLIGNFLQKCKINEYENRKKPSLIDRKTLDELNELANFIKLFLEHQEYFEQNVYSDPVLVDKLTSNLEQTCDLDKKYIDTFRSSRRYSLKERIGIWNYLLCGGDVNSVKEKLGFPSNKAVRNTSIPIRDQQGRPDMMKIMKLYEIEKNRCMQNVSIQEIVLLTVRYKMYNALNSIQNTDECNKFSGMIKKELPCLFAN